MIESEILKIQTVYWKVYTSRTAKPHLIRNGEVGIDGVNANYPSLIINEVSVSMEGEYRCCAINIAGDACGLPSNLIGRLRNLFLFVQSFHSCRYIQRKKVAHHSN